MCRNKTHKCGGVHFKQDDTTARWHTIHLYFIVNNIYRHIDTIFSVPNWHHTNCVWISHWPMPLMIFGCSCVSIPLAETSALLVEVNSVKIISQFDWHEIANIYDGASFLICGFRFVYGIYRIDLFHRFRAFSNQFLSVFLFISDVSRFIIHCRKIIQLKSFWIIFIKIMIVMIDQHFTFSLINYDSRHSSDS